jgi:hypothetical protein
MRETITQMGLLRGRVQFVDRLEMSVKVMHPGKATLTNGTPMGLDSKVNMNVVPEVSSKVVFLSTYIALEDRLLVGFGPGGWFCPM